MALAEPRRRTKWTLNPRGNLWANDENKFGHKLMEKMGWEQGKGLGAKQDGMLAPITIKHKDDSKGVGFQGHDDTWLAHQDDFQAVLAALNAEHGGKPEETEVPEAPKQNSLEATSKNSKKRVHYQKFTRGKDLANYSADDLGCILGTKSDKIKKKKEKEQRDKELEEEAEVGKEEKSHGLVTIQGGTTTDYFAKKMAELKAKGRMTYAPPEKTAEEDEEEEGDDTTGYQPMKMLMNKIKNEASDGVEDGEEQTEEVPVIKEKKKKKSKKEAETVVDEPSEALGDQGEEVTVVKEKKKKKSKKDAMEEAAPVDEAATTVETVEDQSEEATVTKEKKKKKSRKEVTEEPLEEASEPMEVDLEEDKKKKKKSRKMAEESISTEETEVSKETLAIEDKQVPTVIEGDSKKKRKKSKNKKEEDEVKEESITEEKDTVAEDITDEKVKKKKNKKGRKEKTSEQEEMKQEDSGCEEEQLKEKKKKKGKKEKVEREEPERKRKHEEEETAEEPRRKRKKGNRDETSEQPSETPDTPKAPELDRSLGFKGSNILSIGGYGRR